MRVASLRFAVVALVVLVALVFLVKQITSRTEIGYALVVTGATTKMIALFVAAVFAARIATGLGRGNAARGAWMLLAAGLAATTIGQGTLTFYQVTTGHTPFPSIADVAYLTASPLLIAAMISLLRAYSAAGFGMEGQRGVAVIASLGAVVVAIPLLLPILQSAGAPLEKALNVAYPALDLILAVPAILLLRSTHRFRGGAAWKIWAALLVGILLTAAADVLFAFLSLLGQSQLDPSVDALYILAYGGLAAGVLYQQEMLTSS